MLKNFVGKDGFIWFQGVVEDRKDPLKLGRVKVRCFGFDKDDKSEVPTETLPWAIPVVPIDHNAHTVGLREGDWVFGFFRDGMPGQEPVIVGVIPGIPEKKADPAIGFNDPTPDSELIPTEVPRPPEMSPPPAASSSAAASPDRDPKVLPDSGTTVGVFQKDFNILNYPFDLNKDGKYNDEDARILAQAARSSSLDSNPNEFSGGDFFGTVPLSRYPLEDRLKEPDTNIYERGIEDNANPPIVQKKKANLISSNAATHESSGVGSDSPQDGDPFGELATPFAAKYPYNHAQLTESGHLVENDDTPQKERLHRYHRTGTYDEIHPDGNWVMKAVRNIYKFAKENFFFGATKSINITAGEIVRLLAGTVMNLTSNGNMNLTINPGSNLNVYVKGGDLNAKIVGDANIVTEGTAKLHSKKDLFLIVDGNVNAKVKGNWLQDVDGVVRIKGSAVEIDSETVMGLNANVEISEVAPIISMGGLVIGEEIMASTCLTEGIPPLPAIPIPSIPLPNNPDIKENSENEGSSEIVPGYILDQPKAGDLWKPVSDSDGNAVTLSPSTVAPELYEAIPSGELEKVTIKWFNADKTITSWDVVRPKHIKGRLIETARFSGVFGDGRNIFRWKKPGAGYGNSGAILKTGVAEWLLIKVSERHD